MDIDLNEAANLMVAMDLPRIARKDLTSLSEVIAKYRGIRLTMLANGREPDDPVIKELTDLEETLTNARQALQHVSTAMSAPPQQPADMSGGTVQELTEDVQDQNQPKLKKPKPKPKPKEPWE